MERSDLNKYAKRMGMLIDVFAKGVITSHGDNMKDMDITPPQFIVLRFIMDNGSCTMSELSDAMNVTLGNMTGMIDRLARDKYVERTSDPSDRRIVRVSITRKAAEKVKFMSDHKVKGMKHMLASLSESEIKTLFTILEKIADNVKKHTNRKNK